MAAFTTQSLIDAITIPGVKVVGDGNGNLDWMNQRYAEPSVGSWAARLTPGQLEKFDGAGRAAAGYEVWGEQSVTNLTQINAKLYLTGGLYALWSDDTWTRQVEWGGTKGWAAHAVNWGWAERGTFTERTDPVGWGSTTNQGARFMDAVSTWVGANDRLRNHCWGLTYTGPGGFFWTSVNPNSDTGLADRAKLAKLVGLVHVARIAVTGPDAAKSNYAISIGWDMLPETQSMVNPPLRPGSGSGFRAVKDGDIVVCSSLNRDQIARNGPALVALVAPWANSGTATPPPPPPPSADVKHKVRTCLEVDGVQTWTPMVDV